MEINIAKSAGFCFGVRRALKIALETMHSESKVYMLGNIVHNEDVVKKLGKAGIKIIKRLRGGKNKLLLIRAHGASEGIFKKAKRFGYKIIDATCPMVKEIHRIAKVSEKRGYKIIIIGDKEHDEIQGIIGQLKKKPVVIEGIKQIPFPLIKKIKRAAVVVQSTQDLDKTLQTIEILKKYIKNLKFFNTICKPTRIKQEEIKNLSLKNEVVLIIGSKKSANTKRLFQIAKSLNKCTYWIKSRRDIKRQWLKEKKSVAIMAGASTPDTTTQKVIKYLTCI